jgi:hypothetical protein
LKQLLRQPITPHAAIAIPAGVSAVALCTLELARASLGLAWNPLLAAGMASTALFMLSPVSRRSFWKKSAPESIRSVNGVAPSHACD